MWNGQARYVECTDQINGHDFFPLIRVHLFHRSGRTGDARVVHQYIETTQRCDGFRNHPLNIRAVPVVAQGRQQAWDLYRRGIDRLLMDIRDEHSGPSFRECASDLKPDPGRRSRDEYLLRHDCSFLYLRQAS